MKINIAKLDYILDNTHWYSESVIGIATNIKQQYESKKKLSDKQISLIDDIHLQKLSRMRTHQQDHRLRRAWMK